VNSSVVGCARAPHFSDRVGISLATLGLLAGLLAVPGTALGQGTKGERRPFTAREMVGMERLGEPQISPDGKRVVFTRRSYDYDANSTRINLWVVNVDGTGLRALTTAAARDTGPQWRPDGSSIAFLSNRGGAAQIWSIDPAGGEPAPLGKFPVDVSNLQWSPDGSRLAFTAEVFPDCADLQCTADRDKKKESDPVQARVYETLPVRHWDEWEDGKRQHIFVWNPGGGAPVDLLKGLDIDAPTKPFGDNAEYAWSPDGKAIVYVAKSPAEPFAWTTDVDLFWVNADGSGRRDLTKDNLAVDTAPAFSPDGKMLAWAAMSRPGYEADRQQLMVLDLASNARRSITSGWDRSVASVAWLPDGKGLVLTAEDYAREKIFRVDLNGTLTALTTEGRVTSLSVSKSGRLVYLRSSMTSPDEVFTSRLDGKDVKALTAVNGERLSRIALSVPEEFWFTGAHGDKVQGWLLRPGRFEPGRKYPVALIIHGGPQGAIMDSFHYRWNPQAFAGAGYVAVAINFHGSTGFGQSFTDAINKDWGGAPYEDLMKGLDYVLATYGFTDGDRVAALGASYGGWMINWIAGHTDRFRALVSHDGELDITSTYYSTEELWFPEWEFGGAPWQNREMYERWSPEKFVDRWKTPMLVIHGGRDYRLVETEGMSVFTALQRRGVPSKFVLFPDENHWVLKPRNSVFWYDTVLAWIDRYTK